MRSSRARDGRRQSGIYVGAKTGRDGIHGATMASAEFDEGSEEKRPTVQVGDPFREKLADGGVSGSVKAGAVVGHSGHGCRGADVLDLRDGIRAAATGIEIDVSKVPQRETGMTPYEIMLSESQERMLLVVKQGARAGGRADLREVGSGRRAHRARDRDGLLRVRITATVVAEIPNRALADEAPLYTGPWRAGVSGRGDGRLRHLRLRRRSSREIFGASRVAQHLPQTLDREQYDHMLRTNTLVGPGGMRRPAGEGKREGAGVSADSNGRTPTLDPYEGAQLPWLRRRGTSRVRAGNPWGHELPQLRQPRAAGDHVAVRRGDARHGRGVRASDAGHRRQCQPVQRDARRGDLSHPGARHRGHVQDRRAGARFRWRSRTRLDAQ